MEAIQLYKKASRTYIVQNKIGHWAEKACYFFYKIVAVFRSKPFSTKVLLRFQSSFRIALFMGRGFFYFNLETSLTLAYRSLLLNTITPAPACILS